jgi:hypothetical protein
MDREQALQNFWASYGIPAYDEITVPESATMPYITYQVSVGEINFPVLSTASLWYYGRSWKDITAKAHEISDGLNGHTIKYDNGAILLTNGTPRYQRIADTNDMVRRIALNINYEFLER